MGFCLLLKSHLCFFGGNPNVFCNLRCIQRTALYNSRNFQALLRGSKAKELTENSGQV